MNEKAIKNKKHFEELKRGFERISFTDDCFADLGDSCKVLKQKNCKGCGFYKTHTQVAISRKSAMRRIKSLDKPSRIAIAEKYGVEGIVDEK